MAAATAEAAAAAETATAEVKCGRWETLGAAGLPPSVRSGHSLVAHNGMLFCFGGFDGTTHFATLDAAVLAGATATWSPVATAAANPQQPQPPRPRTLHTAAVHAGCMWIVGGSAPRASAAARRGAFSALFTSASDDPVASQPVPTVARFDFGSRAWAELSVEGAAPRLRDGHSCVVHNGQLFVYGGSDDTALFDDVAVLDTAALVWRPVHVAGPVPPARRLHSAVVATVAGEPCMVVFGGYNGRTAFNDVHVLRLATLAWTQPPAPVAGGTPPTPRFGHTAVVRGRHMYVFGGYGSGRGFRRDMHRLNLDEWRWEPVAALGDASPARRCHAAALVTLQDGAEAMVVFGGATSLPGASHLNDTIVFRFAEDGVAGEDAGDDASTAVRATGLGSDLLRLLDDSTFSDITLVTADRKLLVRAHKAVLAARSPVFDRMFRAGMRESGPGAEVVIDECSPEAFQAFLRFLYSGCPAEDDAGLAAELLGLAERFMTPTLKPWCESALLAAMDESSVTSVLAIADRFSCKRLNRAAVVYAARHYRQISKDPEFAKLSQRLLLDIMDELSKLGSAHA